MRHACPLLFNPLDHSEYASAGCAGFDSFFAFGPFLGFERVWIRKEFQSSKKRVEEGAQSVLALPVQGRWRPEFSGTAAVSSESQGSDTEFSGVFSAKEDRGVYTVAGTFRRTLAKDTG